MREVRPGVWHLRVFAGRRANGSPIQLRKVVDSGTGKVNGGVREASKELAKMRADIARRKVRGGGSKTVGELLDIYIERCIAEDLSPTTVHEYRRIADTVLKPALGNVRAAKLDSVDLNSLYRSLRAQGKKPTTVRRVHALVSATFRYAKKEKLFDHNPAADASPPSVKDTPQVQAPAVEQVSALIKAAETRDPMLATLITLAALTGARRGELVGLRWDDWDETGETLRIARSAYKTDDGSVDVKSTKTHQERRIGVDPVAREALRRHRATVQALAAELELTVPDDAYIFSDSPVGTEPLHPNLVTQRSARAARDAGLEHFHFHQLRHFHATQSIAGGFDPVTVGKRLGHRDPNITLRVYSHALEQRDRDLAAAMGRALGGAG
jgi:integrase